MFSVFKHLNKAQVRVPVPYINIIKNYYLLDNKT